MKYINIITVKNVQWCKHLNFKKLILDLFMQALYLIALTLLSRHTVHTVEPQLSEPHGRHTIWSDNRGVRIDEGNRNSRSMGYRVGDN